MKSKKKNDMQINAKGIENLFIISIVHNYGVEKKKTAFKIHLPMFKK
jgi:hypothetical protein